MIHVHFTSKTADDATFTVYDKQAAQRLAETLLADHEQSNVAIELPSGDEYYSNDTEALKQARLNAFAASAFVASFCR